MMTFPLLSITNTAEHTILDTNHNSFDSAVSGARSNGDKQESEKKIGAKHEYNMTVNKRQLWT
jgi:hypothetical protein